MFVFIDFVSWMWPQYNIYWAMDMGQYNQVPILQDAN